MEPVPGVTIAEKYRVERMIARGACGTVYEGEHEELGKRVAIKLIAEDLARSEEVAVRFRQEARAAALVRSDHIVQVFDVGTDEKFGLYMVMELLAGEDLELYLRRQRKLDAHLAVDIATQAARGLAKAHAAGVVHRDLKPANVFLSTRDDGSMLVKLVDFGISKLLRDDRRSRESGAAQTRSGTAVGTPQYMSPEQAQGLAIDHRTDIWALGAVLFEMLAGRPAYEDHEAYEQTIIAIVRDPVPRLADVAPWVSPGLAEVVAGAMEHDLDKRIPDATTFADLLAAAMMDELPLIELGPADETEPPPAPAPSAEAPAEIDPIEQTDQTSAKMVVAPPPQRGRFLRTFVVLFAIVGLLVVVGGVVGRHAETEDTQTIAPAVEPTTSESASASASASVHVKPRPKFGTHPGVKPKVKASASASNTGAPSSSKSFGAAGLSSTY